MTASLTPALALDYVTNLSADVTHAAILDRATRARLAGDPRLAQAAAALPPDAEGRTPAAHLFTASDDHHTIAVLTGPFALARLTRHDLRTALCALSGETAPRTPPEPLEPTLVDTIRSAL
jgi:hypothetical protein